MESDMDQTEQQYIDALFERLRTAERQSPPRDPNAERYISQLISRQPGAPYYMAQAIIIQEETLKAAQARIEELERELEEQPAPQQGGGGGFLGGLFGGGGGGAQPARGGSVPRAGGSVPRAGGAGGFSYPGSGAGAGMGRGPMQPDPTLAQYNQGSRGGGFLAGAMQTAVGVAGGVLLGNMIGNMLGGDEAKAGEAAKPEEAAKGEEAGKTEQAGADQNQQADDPFANVENTQYDDNDSVFGGDFGGGDFDI
jgi:uncharacterized protein